ncbi:MAG: type II toxin-antitoxin system HicB family antitoxin [Elusimicrobia bacterium]|nr:type II toxin-antitoxin system HicB family antitoxin [Elusimicrobiota bacterium]
MNIQVVIEYDRRAKSYAAHCPELPGCTSVGDTEKEALKNIRKAIDLYLQPYPIKPSTTRKITSVKV